MRRDPKPRSLGAIHRPYEASARPVARGNADSTQRSFTIHSRSLRLGRLVITVAWGWLLATLLLVLVVACKPAPGQTVVGGEGNGQWSYATGPHGEHCLFYQENSSGSARVLAMACDSVHWDR